MMLSIASQTHTFTLCAYTSDHAIAVLNKYTYSMQIQI